MDLIALGETHGGPPAGMNSMTACPAYATRSRQPVHCNIAGLGHRQSATYFPMVRGLMSTAMTYLMERFFCP